jgi:hypothetical protein
MIIYSYETIKIWKAFTKSIYYIYQSDKIYNNSYFKLLLLL